MNREDRETRWVLGFDGGCCACSDIAKQIVDLSRGRMSAASLRSCMLLKWREQTLGADAPWLSTLFAVEGEQVRAWTGPGLAWHLARQLGPGKMWQVIRILGELNTAQAPDSVADPSRRRVVKAVGGAAVAFGIVVGKPGLLPTSTTAQQVGAAESVRWTFDKPDAAVRRRMEDQWRGEELRAFRAWLDQHSFRPYAEGAPQYTIARRNGELSHRTVTEAWRDGRQVAVGSLLMGRNGSTMWKTIIHRESDGDIVRRLRLNDAKRAEEEPGDGISRASIPNPCNWDWLWCPSPCQVCNGTCTLFIGGGGALGIKECLIGCYGKWGPLWGTFCSALCSSLVAYGAFAVQEFGCEQWFCGDVIGAC